MSWVGACRSSLACRSSRLKAMNLRWAGPPFVLTWPLQAQPNPDHPTKTAHSMGGRILPEPCKPDHARRANEPLHLATGPVRDLSSQRLQPGRGHISSDLNSSHAFLFQSRASPQLKEDHLVKIGILKAARESTLGWRQGSCEAAGGVKFGSSAPSVGRLGAPDAAHAAPCADLEVSRLRIRRAGRTACGSSRY